MKKIFMFLKVFFKLLILPAIYVRVLDCFGIKAGYGWMFIANNFILWAISPRPQKMLKKQAKNKSEFTIKLT